MERRPHDDASDSEDDPDYLPANDGAAESSDEERDVKRQRTSSPKPTDEELEEKKKAREALWEQFKESVSAPAGSAAVAAPMMVKIEKRYRYAGEEVREVKEVPEDSEEAKKWPRWQDSATPSEAGPSSSPPIPNAPRTPGPSSSAIPPGPSEGATPTPARSAKRPGPRKPKIILTPLPTTQKAAKKLTTLDKSAIDWRSHLDTTIEPVKDELEANRRGGGYLEKVEFLERVADRRDDVLDASKSTKRRR
ncbi:hypothetical protein EIP91_002990 [Steccherinum ochraceum]|uniref:SWR1-complex protein 5 n=1 Tax=Steccherinum ochraceum TaxID=92696 RepID=A0A4R0RRW8_9APHY|nr:hypothetical protein EIP91_002990 [Steccherinum ochraceum]